MSRILKILQALWNAKNPHATNEFVTESVVRQVEAKATAAQTAADELMARIDGMYPVGCIWITLGPTDPNTILPGTWAKTAKGRVIIGTGTLDGIAYNAEEIGGTAFHTLTVEELPSHCHDNFAYTTVDDDPVPHAHGGAAGLVDESYLERCDPPGATGGVAAAPLERGVESSSENHTKATGGGQAHENRPPYLAANIWQRTL
jgi:microcystin-dependent protein